MAQLPGRRARGLRGPALGLALLLGLLAAPAAAVELEGTWHVLIHYTDDNTSSPEQMRWSDRVWVFERKGKRLQWTEYPIAVFRDEQGRFERRASGQYARVLGAWEPDEAQLVDIEEGLQINNRGSKKKSLRGSDAEGWRTVSRSRPGSASMITYTENWSVAGLPERPVFEQQDVMGSARSETLEGVTRWETTEVEDGMLVGRFERDGTRHGRFFMRRAGPVAQLEEKTQAEIQQQGLERGMRTSRMARDMVKEELERALADEGVELSDEELDAVAAAVLDASLRGAEREELQALIRTELAPHIVDQALARELAARGLELDAETLDALAAEAREGVVAGESREQIEERLRELVERRLGEGSAGDGR